MDLIQTLVKHFHIAPGLQGRTELGKEREEEFGKGSKKENWESGSYMKYRSLGSNMSYCSLQPRGNMKIRMNSKGILCRPAGHTKIFYKPAAVQNNAPLRQGNNSYLFVSAIVERFPGSRRIQNESRNCKQV